MRLLAPWHINCVRFYVNINLHAGTVFYTCMYSTYNTCPILPLIGPIHPTTPSLSSPMEDLACSSNVNGPTQATTNTKTLHPISVTCLDMRHAHHWYCEIRWRSPQDGRPQYNLQSWLPCHHQYSNNLLTSISVSFSTHYCCYGNWHICRGSGWSDCKCQSFRDMCGRGRDPLTEDPGTTHSMWTFSFSQTLHLFNWLPPAWPSSERQRLTWVEMLTNGRIMRYREQATHIETQQ